MRLPLATHGGLDTIGCLFRRLVFPHANHLPAGRTERSIGLPVPRDVALELLTPPLGVALGPRLVNGADMPEASVYEHRDTGPHEHDIRARAHLWHGSQIDAKPKAPPM